jgi:Bacterial regulatory protein, Fis family
LGAPAKVSDPRVVEALVMWDWNITASAEELGITRSALTKRMNVMKARGTLSRPPRTSTSGTFAGTASAPISRTKSIVFRYRPDQLELLRQFKFDYQARHREEVDEAELMRRFFDAAVRPWMKDCLE